MCRFKAMGSIYNNRSCKFSIVYWVIILVVDKLPGFFQPFSNIIGYTIIISPLLREIVKSLFKLFSFVNYIPLKRSLMRIIKVKQKI